jgi:hypothetical protein
MLRLKLRETLPVLLEFRLRFSLNDTGSEMFLEINRCRRSEGDANCYNHEFQSIVNREFCADPN